MKPHKHAALIKAWADGAEIQRLSPVRGWEDIYTTPLWDNICEQFRIKPKTIKYRTALMATLTNLKYVATCNNPDDTGVVMASNGFIKWIGDWQVVEV